MSHIPEAEAATRLGVSRRTLRRWRAAGRDVPAHARLHGRIVYDREDVDAWAARQFTPRIAAQTTKEAPGGHPGPLTHNAEKE